MSAEEKLLKLMQLGYDVHIECKGKGRLYEFTYEGSIKLIVVNGDAESFLKGVYSVKHAVGDTFDELADNLLSQVNPTDHI